MTRYGLLALMSHWQRNRLQLFTLLAGLTLATALWSGVQAVNSEARASYDSAAATLGEAEFRQILPRDGDVIRQSDYIALRRSGWLVSPVLDGRLNNVRLVGLDPVTSPGGLGPVDMDQGPDLQGFITGQGILFGTMAALEQIDLPQFHMIIDENMAPGTVITDIGTAQILLNQPNAVSRLLLHPDQPMKQPDLQTITPDLSIQEVQTGSDIARLTESFHLNLTAFGLLAFAVGIFIVHGAIGLAFEQRRSLIRTLRALGIPLRRLIGLLMFEITCFALIGGVFGVALGYAIAAALLPDVAATLQGLYGATVSGTLALRPSWWLSGMGIALGGAGLASAKALWQIAQMPLLASARPRAWSMHQNSAKSFQIVGALSLLAIAAILSQLSIGLVAGFAMLGALLLGAALALPIVLSCALSLGARLSKNVIPQWFWADSRQQLPGLSLALMALLLAMAANVGVSTMVSSFRLTFVGFLDQRLTSELYVYGDDADHAEQLLSIVEPHVDAILPILRTEVDIAALPSQLYGARAHESYAQNWTFLQANADPWQQVFSGQGVVVNEQMSRRGGLKLGDVIALGADLSLPIVGIYGDYGNPIGQAVIAEPLFEAHYPNVRVTRLGLRLPPENVPDLMQTLRDAGLADTNMIDQAGIKDFSLKVFERTFTVTGALNVLTLAVAAFAILMSLLTLAGMRLPQLAPVWALGLTRGQLGRLELIRAMLLAVMTALFALPLGLTLAWALLSVVNVAAFGWKLPIYFFPWDYARLGLFSLVAAGLAALWPARRLARTPPSDLLKVFSNER
ncbi:ABC transporter permease [Aestuariibius sp. HNIBRBA575]|uniref:ABC transporter permease n=1 Tax=Aestuariibius sp. HNIBRBA575 TaxID=3233343 RepID=UPI0034A2D6C3